MQVKNFANSQNVSFPGRFQIFGENYK